MSELNPLFDAWNVVKKQQQTCIRVNTGHTAVSLELIASKTRRAEISHVSQAVLRRSSETVVLVTVSFLGATWIGRLIMMPLKSS